MNSNINNFNFSFTLANKAKNELQKEFDSIDGRINNILESEKFTINGFPVLKNIMILNPSKNDLKVLAKAIERLADLIEIHESAHSKLKVAEAVQQDPTWFAWTFGDFSGEVDDAIDKLFNTKD